MNRAERRRPAFANVGARCLGEIKTRPDGSHDARCSAALPRCGRRWCSPSNNPRHRAATNTPHPPPPIVVFVHGNGDSSALWINNIWRFEANGYKRNQLFAIDFAYPSARREDAKPELFRSSAEEQMKELAAFVQQALKATGRRKVALVGSSRGGNAIRSFLKHGGGAQLVSHAVLCGTPNKGIINSDSSLGSVLVGSEFNGAYTFLKELNAGPDDAMR